MSIGKDPGLDRPNWIFLDPSKTTTQRRESATGVNARSRNTRTYSQVTSPDIKSKTEENKPMDSNVLTLLGNHLLRESKEENLSKITSRKIDIKLDEETVIDKVDTNSTAVLFRFALILCPIYAFKPKI